MTTGVIDVSDTDAVTFDKLFFFIHMLQETKLRAVLIEIKNTQQKMNDILGKKIALETRDSDRIQYFLHALRVFQAEFSAHLKEWDQLSQDVDVGL